MRWRVFPGYNFGLVRPACVAAVLPFLACVAALLLVRKGRSGPIVVVVTSEIAVHSLIQPGHVTRPLRKSAWRVLRYVLCLRFASPFALRFALCIAMCFALRFVLRFAFRGAFCVLRCLAFRVAL